MKLARALNEKSADDLVAHAIQRNHDLTLSAANIDLKNIDNTKICYVVKQMEAIKNAYLGSLLNSRDKEEDQLALPSKTLGELIERATEIEDLLPDIVPVSFLNTTEAGKEITRCVESLRVLTSILHGTNREDEDRPAKLQTSEDASRSSFELLREASQRRNRLMRSLFNLRRNLKNSSKHDLVDTVVKCEAMKSVLENETLFSYAQKREMKADLNKKSTGALAQRVTALTSELFNHLPIVKLEREQKADIVGALVSLEGLESSPQRSSDLDLLAERLATESDVSGEEIGGRVLRLDITSMDLFLRRNEIIVEKDELRNNVETLRQVSEMILGLGNLSDPYAIEHQAHVKRANDLFTSMSNTLGVSSRMKLQTTEAPKIDDMLHNLAILDNSLTTESYLNATDRATLEKIDTLAVTLSEIILNRATTDTCARAETNRSLSGSLKVVQDVLESVCQSPDVQRNKASLAMSRELPSECVVADDMKVENTAELSEVVLALEIEKGAVDGTPISTEQQEEARFWLKDKSTEELHLMIKDLQKALTRDSKAVDRFRSLQIEDFENMDKHKMIVLALKMQKQFESFCREKESVNADRESKTSGRDSRANRDKLPESFNIGADESRARCLQLEKQLEIYRKVVYGVSSSLGEDIDVVLNDWKEMKNSMGEKVLFLIYWSRFCCNVMYTYCTDWIPIFLWC